MPKTIVAIGGGKLYLKETLPIDKEIIKLTGKIKPKALFIPTASDDNEEFYDSFKKVYGKLLKCKTDVLYLIKDKKKLDKKQIRDKILNTDLIYVSGGSTLNLLKIWRKNGIDKILKQAYDKGIILSGASAGAVCWFLGGYSDMRANKWIYVNCLGFINSFYTAHYNREEVKNNFKKLIKKSKQDSFGFANEDNSAIIFIDDRYKIINSDKKAKGYTAAKNKNIVKIEEIKIGKEYVF